MKDLKKEIEEIKSFADSVMQGDAEYDGADGARDIIKLCNLYEELLQEERKKGREEGVKGKVFNRIEINEEVNIPTEIVDNIRLEEKNKTLEEVNGKIADMALEKWGGQIGKEILVDTSEVISKLLKEGNEKE